MPAKNNNTWSIVYFSGTGGTACCARWMAEALASSACEVVVGSLEEQSGASRPEVGGRHLCLLYPVHAADAPDPLYHWLAGLEQVSDQTAVVLSVSGGGQMWPNNDCRRRVVRLLEHKGYTVQWDSMLVMPSNWTIATPSNLVPFVYAATRRNIRTIASALLAGKSHRSATITFSRAVSWLGALERSGAWRFGAGIRVSGACTGCGWCIRSCPVGNISPGPEGKPVFGRSCILCMRCLYGCPANALHPSVLQFMYVSEGFKLVDATRADLLANEAEELVLHLPSDELKRLIQSETTSLRWKGVKVYLERSLSGPVT